MLSKNLKTFISPLTGAMGIGPILNNIVIYLKITKPSHFISLPSHSCPLINLEQVLLPRHRIREVLAGT